MPQAGSAPVPGSMQAQNQPMQSQGFTQQGPGYNYVTNQNMYNPEGQAVAPLGQQASDLYNTLTQFTQNTPQNVIGSEQQMSKLAGTFGNTPEFQKNLAASTQSAVDARGKILAQRAQGLYPQAGVTAPTTLNQDTAQQSINQMSTVTPNYTSPRAEMHLVNGRMRYGLWVTDTVTGQRYILGTEPHLPTSLPTVPTTTPSGDPNQAAGFTGRAGTDYATQLQSLLGAYTNLPTANMQAARSLGGNRLQTQQAESSLNQIDRYEMQQQANQLRTQLGLPTSPEGFI